MEEELLHVNPCPPSWLSEEQKAVLRGDTVAGTAYNERWLLNTLMTILKAEQELLPSLQKEANLTTYDFTPKKPSVPVGGCSPLSTPQHVSGSDASTPVIAGAAYQSADDGDDASNDSGDDECNDSQVSVVDVSSDVESAACQLWDMCADEHVASHVLHLNDRLVLDMLAYALRDTTAPRLTETLCGIVRNLCCYSEGSMAVLQDLSLLQLLLTLPERCTDSPALLQALMLLHTLLWYLQHMKITPDKPLPFGADTASVTTDTYVAAAGKPVTDAHTSVTADHTPADTSLTVAASVATVNSAATEGHRPRVECAKQEEDESEEDATIGLTARVDAATAEELTSNLSVALHKSSIENFLAFVLKNSCNEVLVQQSVLLLEQLLFFKDPLTKVFMANNYAQTDIVSGLLHVVGEWHRRQQGQGEQQGGGRSYAIVRFNDDEEDDEFECAAKYEEDNKITLSDPVHPAFICLYAFVDTKAIDVIVSSEGEEHSLEPALVHYITELVTAIEDQLRIHKTAGHATVDQQPPQISNSLPTAAVHGEAPASQTSKSAHLNSDLASSGSKASDGVATEVPTCHHSSSLRQFAEKLSCAVKLLSLLKRNLRLPEVILALAKLIALLDHSGIACDDAQLEEDGCQNQDGDVDTSWKQNGGECGQSGTHVHNYMANNVANGKNCNNIVKNKENGCVGIFAKGNMTRDSVGKWSSMDVVEDLVVEENGARDCSTPFRANPAPGDLINIKSIHELNEKIRRKSEPTDKIASKNPNKSVNILDQLDMLAVDKYASELQKSKDKQNALRIKQRLQYQRELNLKNSKRNRRRSSLLNESYNDVTQVKDSEEISCLSPATLAELRDMRQSLEQYFASIFHYWFMFGDLKEKNGTLCNLLNALQQCHVHEVLLVLYAVKKLDLSLVPQIQELLLDQQAFPRIVMLLAKLYQ